jgi:hypothetical protein
VGVTGHAIMPASPTSSALWAPELTAGLGMVLILRPEYAIRAQATAIFVEPSPYVTIGTTNESHAGRPLLMFSVTLERGLPVLPAAQIR